MWWDRPCVDGLSGPGTILVDVVKAGNEVDQLGMFPMTTAANHPFEVSVSVNGRAVNFAVNTGASTSFIRKQTWFIWVVRC